MSTRLLHLEDRLTRLSVAPEQGGSLVNWTVKGSDQALLRHSDQAALEAGTARRLGCYPLAPWSNRIAKGGVERPDGWLELPPNTSHDPYPIHGSAWQQAWQVGEHSESSLALHLESTLPFAYRAEQRISLEDGRLNLELRVTHTDTRAAWHGLGFHPYLPRTAHTRLHARAARIWLGDGSGLPTHEADIPAHWNFQAQSPLPHDLLDHAFSGWDGHCQIIQEDAGYRLDCQASGAGYYLVFCPVDQGFFCFEPVSHPINAHHLPGRPGLQLLHQGESTQLSFSLHYRPLA